MGGVGGLDTHGVAFSDIDGDGDDDLFEVSGRNNDNRLLKNTNGSLSQVNAGALTDNGGRGRQPLFLDFDIDGDMDVIITNLDLRSPPVPERAQLAERAVPQQRDGTIVDQGRRPVRGHETDTFDASKTSTGPGTPADRDDTRRASVARDR